ncbi:MAG: glycoside hydrolase family 88 protein [Paludibacteraceae bacterium]|nr:glycoside hydrolase family 88 protein [Paludibacteraceae bacterium]
MNGNTLNATLSGARSPFETGNRHILKLSIILLLLLTSVTLSAKKTKSTYEDWAIRIAQSEMRHNPELWRADFVKKPKWDYTQGLIAYAMMNLYDETKDTTYLRYVQDFADYFIEKDGTIKTYQKETYNIDRINGGKFLFLLYQKTKDERLKNAICLLRSQLDTHPRMKCGVFWHKKIYPEQVWLDGLYMGAPFYAQCIKTFKEDKNRYDDVARQFVLTDSLTIDQSTGLNYHAYDDAREQPWANKETGHSPGFWGRSMGWYMMAMCDVLDYLPKNHPDRARIIANLNRLANALLLYQDKQTKLWYQVPNYPGREGNYLESSCSAMFIYAYAKGARKGYLPYRFVGIAKEAFEGFVQNATQTNADGTTSITRACGVAGLGGTPYRSGTYEYYIGEKVLNDDPKVVGPFILAALELNKLR